MIIDFAVWTVFPGLLALAAALDLLTMTIPNRLSLALAAGFLVLAPLTGLGSGAIGAHLLCGLAMLAAGFALFAAGWIGGGDAKLLAATVLWLGWPHLLDYLVLAAVLGGALTLGLLVLRAVPLPAIAPMPSWAARLHRPDEGVPYGIALAAAGLLIYPDTLWMAAG